MSYEGNFVDFFRDVKLTNEGYLIVSDANGGGGNPLPASFVFVDSLNDLPAPVGGVITLPQSYTYYFTEHIDLLGSRIVCEKDVTILGSSSENCSLTSTGLSASEYLVYSDFTLPIRHITFKNVGKAIGINATNIGIQPIALDWTGVNFSGCTTNLYCGDIDNFIFSKGAILDAGVFEFVGTTGTIGIDNSLFVGGSGTLIKLGASAQITRRFRIIYSSFVAFGTCTAINTTRTSIIPVDSYIIDTCNFSGGGTYIVGYGEFKFDNQPRFVNCKGISNTASVGNYHMSGNTTPTIFSAVATPTKIAGVTTLNAITQKFSHSNNRLTYTGELLKDFEVKVVATIESNSSNDQIGFYVAKNGAVIEDSEMYVTTDARFRAESVAIQTILTLTTSDYIEIWVENNTDSSDMVVSFLNVIIKALE